MSLADITSRLLGMREKHPQAAQVRGNALLASFLLASPPPKTLRGVKLADSTLDIIPPRPSLSPGGTMRRLATKPGTDIMPERLATPSDWGASQEQVLMGPMFFC